MIVTARIAEELDTDRRLDTGGQHVDARLDRHGPGVGEAGELHPGVELFDDRLDRRAGGPGVSGRQNDRRFDHGERRWVGRGLGASDLAADMRYLWM